MGNVQSPSEGKRGYLMFEFDSKLQRYWTVLSDNNLKLFDDESCAVEQRSFDLCDFGDVNVGKNSKSEEVKLELMPIAPGSQSILIIIPPSKELRSWYQAIQSMINETTTPEVQLYFFVFSLINFLCIFFDRI